MKRLDHRWDSLALLLIQFANKKAPGERPREPQCSASNTSIVAATHQADKRGRNTHARDFDSDVSVELEAIDPDTLRRLVREAIEQHINKDEQHVLRTAEESERHTLQRLIYQMQVGKAVQG